MSAFKETYIEWNDVFSQISEYNYALIYNISEKLFFKIGTKEFDLDQCIEARFFCPEKELHLFDYNGEKKAVKIEDNSTDYLDKIYPLANEHKNLGKMITVRKYLDYDEDGQAFIAATRLVSIH